MRSSADVCGGVGIYLVLSTGGAYGKASGSRDNGARNRVRSGIMKLIQLIIMFIVRRGQAQSYY